MLSHNPELCSLHEAQQQLCPHILVARIHCARTHSLPEKKQKDGKNDKMQQNSIPGKPAGLPLQQT
jgi:hypothetical protein